MNNMDTTENEMILRDWFIKRNIGETTQYPYKIALKAYCKQSQKTPVELIDEAETEEETGVRFRRRKINTYMFGFLELLKEQGKAPNTINNYISTINSFYKAFNIKIPDITLEKGDICLEKNYTRLLKREDISRMIAAAGPRDKAIIYTMALTGMSQAEARKLTIRKLLQTASEELGKEINTVENLLEYEEELKKVILTLHITRKKVNYRYFTFLPPEATLPILTYLRVRLYGKNLFLRINSLDEPLFVTNRGQPLSKQNLTNHFRRIGKSAGFKSEEKGAYRFWRSHGLRKYFISTIINEIGDHIFADFLVGHKIPNVKRSYWQADTEKIKKTYFQALPYLSIDEIKVKDVKSKEYKILTEKLDKKTEEVNELKSQIELEQAKVNKKLERLEKLVGSETVRKAEENVKEIEKHIPEIENPEESIMRFFGDSKKKKNKKSD